MVYSFEVRGKRSTRAYVGTMDPTNEFQLEDLKSLRANVSEWNKENPDRMFRVCVKGREAIVKRNGRSYNFGGDIVGGLRNAKRWDLYVQRRYGDSWVSDAVWHDGHPFENDEVVKLFF